jgi:hypothetical protein
VDNQQGKSKNYHRNPLTGIRFSEEELEMIDKLAIYLHKEGIFGVTDREGKAIKRSVLSHLIKEKLKQYEPQE